MRLSAQVQVGETSMNLNGTVSVGYNDDYSNYANSDHGIQGGGTADLTGSYYSPNFLSFSIQPFYNQSRVNSDYQSITAASGVSASASIFSGSHFPGSVSYSKTYNSSGNYSIPGIANYTTHGNNDAFAATWGAHVQGLPSLNVAFSEGTNAYTVYGLDTEGNNHYDTFSAMSSYRIAGFNMNGGYQYTSSRAITPELLTNETTVQSDSNGNSLFFGIGQNLPWNGSISGGATRSNINTDADGVNYNTSIDAANGNLVFAPLKNLSFGANTYYTNNLEGTLYSSLISAGVIPSQDITQQYSSDSLNLTSFVNYELPAVHMYLRGFTERQQQNYLGTSYLSNSYNGNATYSNSLFGGQFNGTIGITRTSLNTTNQTLTGLNGGINYIRRIAGWNVSGSANYSQDTQTILAAYTSSGYNYSGSLGRKFGRRYYWGATATGTRSILTDQPGSANDSQSYTTTIALPLFSVTGAYSKSSGNALLTPNGLVPSPVPVSALPPGALVFYNGDSYSIGIGANPIRGLTISATFAKALSGTESILAESNNNTENVNVFFLYHLRKLNVQGGYTKLNQGFSATATPPTMVGSFFIGISRWFNFF